jgi:hypothetical protein
MFKFIDCGEVIEFNFVFGLVRLRLHVQMATGGNDRCQRGSQEREKELYEWLVRY